MASNVASAVSDFLKTEGKRQLRGMASDVIAGAVGGRGGQGTRQQVSRRTNLAGAMLLPGGLGTTTAVRGLSNIYQKQFDFVGAMTAKGASPEAGQVLQGSIEMAKNQMNAFTNLFTAPGIKSIGEFFSVMADAPSQIVSFGEALLSVTKRLKDVSPEFAQISAEQEIRQLQRDIQTGSATGESAGKLSESIENLKDEMLPLQNDIYNATADLVTDLVPTVREIYALLSPFIKALLPLVADILKAITSLIVPLLMGVIQLIELAISITKGIASWLPGGAKALLNGTAIGAELIVNKMTKNLEELSNKFDPKDINAHRDVVSSLFSGRGNRRPR